LATLAGRRRRLEQAIDQKQLLKDLRAGFKYLQGKHYLFHIWLCVLLSLTLQILICSKTLEIYQSLSKRKESLRE
jgi:hypothetical protein